MADDERRRREQQDRERERVEQLQQRMRMLVADPFDMEAQNLIAREIQQQNIESNMETAMEYHPEAYGQVNMLYIKCKVNGHDVKAFVDSGAQSTIMSNACAERCNLTRLIDSRWSGIAKGVGTQKIIGRIHLCQVQIEKDFLASSFTILQDQSMDMLLGLDMLKRHQCSIDLKRNLLSIGTTGTETSFLNESECPDFTKSRPPDMADEDAEIADAINRSIQENPNSQAATHNAPTLNVPEATINELTQMGFNRQQVIEALTQFGGNKELAIASLLAKSLTMPR